eukprot:7388074-Prymnesium_polylepis.3
MGCPRRARAACACGTERAGGECACVWWPPHDARCATMARSRGRFCDPMWRGRVERDRQIQSRPARYGWIIVSQDGAPNVQLRTDVLCCAAVRVYGTHEGW